MPVSGNSLPDSWACRCHPYHATYR